MFCNRFVPSSILLTGLTLLLLNQPAQAQFEQSPIDIRSGNTIYSVLDPLNFSYSSSSNLHVINTGSPDVEATVRAVVPGGDGSVTLAGDTYALKQFHFHTGAEHLLNGHRSPMEMHMVHQDVGGHLLVVGRFIEEEATDNAAFTTLFSNLPPTSADTFDITGFNLNDLLPGGLGSYRYPGSLTTAPYTEGVSWVVLDTPLLLSHSQIVAFQNIFPEGDSREVQTLNGRVIRTDVLGFAAPEPGSIAFLMLVGTPLIGCVVRRRK